MYSFKKLRLLWIFSQTWIRYVWLMLSQIRLSVICDVHASYTQGFNFSGIFLHHIVAWPSGNSLSLSIGQPGFRPGFRLNRIVDCGLKKAATGVNCLAHQFITFIEFFCSACHRGDEVIGGFGTLLSRSLFQSWDASRHMAIGGVVSCARKAVTTESKLYCVLSSDGTENQVF